MGKSVKTFFGCWVLFTILLYAVGAFIWWDFNPGAWHEGGRFVLGIGWFATFFLSAGIASDS